MSKWNIVFLVFIFILGAVGIFFSAKVLKVNYTAGTSYEKKKDELAKATKDVEDIMKWENLPTLEVKSNVILNDISEHWRNCQPMNTRDLSNQHTEIEFTLDIENVSPMKVGETLYAFDQRPTKEGGCYLGRFMVTKVQAQAVTASSIDILTGVERQQLEKSKQETQAAARSGDASADGAAPSQAGWVMYLKCPTNSFYLLSTLTEDERNIAIEVLPEALQAPYRKYIADVEEFQKNPEEGVWPQAPQGFVHDYGTFLTAAYQRRIENAMTKADLQSQLSDLENSQKEAAAYQNALRNENDDLRENQTLINKQKAEVQKLLQELEQEIANLKKKIQDTQKSNEKMVNELQTYHQQSVSQSASATTNY